MGEKRSIAVAGCGVAGLAAAALLARAGHRVVVYDRLATPAPIGSGLILQPVGLVVLDHMGAGAAMRALGAPIVRLYGALFSVLLDAARAAGAILEPSHEIASADAYTLTFASGAVSPRFDLVIDALGMRSPLSRKQAAPLPFGALWTNVPFPEGFAPDTLEQRYEHARKMAGVLPIGRLPGETRAQASFFWSLKGADYQSWRDAPLDTWKAEGGRARALATHRAAARRHHARRSRVRPLRAPHAHGADHRRRRAYRR
jgi:2-polyprenyl-6-methoxyphenol hydroxylase-like FAD-dependent oxidoreductase